MSFLDDVRFRRYISGLSTPLDRVQSREETEGDPQIAALVQYLSAHRKNWSSDRIVVDLGCGDAILAPLMLGIWPEADLRPEYWAVDLPEPLDRLLLPTAIHNHSRKVSTEDLLTTELPKIRDQIAAVVVRNVFHELDIATTARILVTLSRVLTSETDIYIQDLAYLPIVERGRLGWAPDLFRTYLKDLGFTTEQFFELKSRSGTPWFSLVARAGQAPPSLGDAEARCAALREEQRAQIVDRLIALGSSSDDSTSLEFQRLSDESSAITTQLQQWNYTREARAKDPVEILFAGRVPLLPIDETPVDYTIEFARTDAKSSGLLGIIASKNFLNIPRLLTSARNTAWFAGYSQRGLFRSKQMLDALSHAVRMGVDVRILLAAPTSDAAQARAKSALYGEPEGLFREIRLSEKLCAKLIEQFRNDLGDENAERCRCQSTEQLLSCSYFIIDDLCFASLYTQRLSGSSGQCLVFQHVPENPRCYFTALHEDFQLCWGDAEK